MTETIKDFARSFAQGVPQGIGYGIGCVGVVMAVIYLVPGVGDWLLQVLALLLG